MFNLPEHEINDVSVFQQLPVTIYAKVLNLNDLINYENVYEFVIIAFAVGRTDPFFSSFRCLTRWLASLKAPIAHRKMK